MSTLTFPWQVDDVGETVGKWWGAAARDERGNVIDTSMEEGPVTDEMERMGRRAQQLFRLLPRFPHHRNRYHCTHRGLLMEEHEDARVFVAALCAVCEWYGYLPDEPLQTNEEGEEVRGPLREELQNSSVFAYLASDDCPPAQRNNNEDVFLKAGSLWLFQNSMPEISDFAQNRRELNGHALSLAQNGEVCAACILGDALTFATYLPHAVRSMPTYRVLVHAELNQSERGRRACVCRPPAFEASAQPLRGVH